MCEVEPSCGSARMEFTGEKARSVPPGIRVGLTRVRMASLLRFWTASIKLGELICIQKVNGRQFTLIDLLMCSQERSGGDLTVPFCH